MSKTKQLQTEVDDLKKQLDYWKNTASTYSVASLNLRKDINLQAQRHNEELTKTVTLLAKDAAKAMDQLQADAERAILKAERDTIGQAYKYMVDRLAGGQ